jgi:hypothetical protein
MKPEFLIRFKNNTKIKKFMKIRPIGTEQTDIQINNTHMAKILIVSRNVAKPPINTGEETDQRQDGVCRVVGITRVQK